MRERHRRILLDLEHVLPVADPVLPETEGARSRVAGQEEEQQRGRILRGLPAPAATWTFRASLIGQTATQSRQLVHSGLQIASFCETGWRAMQTLSQSPQSMQLTGSRRIFAGDIHETSPSSAP